MRVDKKAIRIGLLPFYATCHNTSLDIFLQCQIENQNRNSHDRRRRHDDIQSWTGVIKYRVDANGNSKLCPAVQEDERIQKFIPRDHKRINKNGDDRRESKVAG